MPDFGGNSGPMVIAHVSRLGSGAGPNAAAEILATDIAAAAPALTVVTADHFPAEHEERADPRSALLRLLPGPHLMVQESREVRREWPARLGLPGRPRSDVDPVVQVPGARALGLRPGSTWWSGPGRVSSRQAAAVAEVLGAAPYSTLRLLALRHPPLFNAGSALVRALVDARVELLLAAHAQVPSVRRVELSVEGRAHRLVVAVAGAANHSDLVSDSSWCLICVDPVTITVQERHLLDSGWHAGRTVRYRRYP